MRLICSCLYVVGLQAWDVSGVDINEELTNLANAAPTGSEDGPDGGYSLVDNIQYIYLNSYIICLC